MGDKYFPVYSIKPKRYGPKPAEYSDNMMKTNSRATNRLHNEQHLIDRARNMVTKDIAREKTLLEENYRKSKTSLPLSSYRQLESVRPRTITSVTPRHRPQEWSSSSGGGGITSSSSSSSKLKSSSDSDNPGRSRTFITQRRDSTSSTKPKVGDNKRLMETPHSRKEKENNDFLVQGSKIS